ncbi:MAG TPA: RNA pseudouridine synthase [Burkholderiaceae bacterium]
MIEAIRLSKRLAGQLPCSRRDAELFIEGGWVQVDGQTIEEPQHRVTAQQQVVLATGALAQPVPPATLLWHQPAGDAAATPTAAQHEPTAAAQPQVLRRHLAGQTCVTPLEPGASGLVVFTQDGRIRRRLLEDEALLEHEFMVDVNGQPAPEILRLLAALPTEAGRAAPTGKVSLSRQGPQGTRLRFALKGWQPGQITWMCQAVGLQITAIQRLRIGRVALAGLPTGRWRFLGPHERF